MSEDNNTVVTLKVRVTPEFREKIVATAKENNRSMNQEIVHRLEQSFDDLPTPINNIDLQSQSVKNPIKNNRVANDPRERRRLAKIAAEKAFMDMSAQDLVETLFNKLHSEGTRLTVEEVKKANQEVDITREI